MAIVLRLVTEIAFSNTLSDSGFCRWSATIWKRKRELSSGWRRGQNTVGVHTVRQRPAQAETQPVLQVVTRDAVAIGAQIHQRPIITQVQGATAVGGLHGLLQGQ